MSDTDEELLVTVNTIILLCALLVRRRRARNRTRRFWVRPVWRYRDTEGQARTLLPRLRARDEGYFRDYLRMPPSVFDTLLSLVRPLIERQATPFRDPISAHDRLSMTIRFLANGDTFRSLSYNFLTGRSTACEIVRQTTSALWDVLQSTYLRFPATSQEWLKVCLCYFHIAADMEEFWHFPNCIGSIDGKHVHIQCPDNSGSMNLNYKKRFSVALLAVCDAHYKFTYVDIGHYGGEGDSGIFQRSPLLEMLEKGLLGIPQPRSIGSIGPIPYHMVGDEAFPLKPFMMRPYPRRELQKFRNDPAQRQEYLKRATFNYRLSRARRLIEDAFGIMSSRWRILRRPFRASEETTQNIVKSCVVLLNFLLSSPQSRSAYSPPGFTDHEDWEGNIVEGSWRAGSDSLPGMGDLITMSGYHSARTAMDMRNHLATYFMNEGRVPWQERIVTRAGIQEK
ncbi:uncharacterized protein [Dermacentor andersoni]|uniref:uncharacterized protein n=1 Tax=Dermacentor andersoni TaxID=34620 RepID=UPI003B3A401A